MTDEDIIDKVHEILDGTLKEMASMGKDMETVKESQLVMAKSHEVLAYAAKSMAATFEKAEERQSRLEETNMTLFKHKGVSPNVFFLVTATLCSVIALGAVWLTDTSVKATLTSFEAGRRQAERLQAVKEEILEEARDGEEEK